MPSVDITKNMYTPNCRYSNIVASLYFPCSIKVSIRLFELQAQKKPNTWAHLLGVSSKLGQTC